MRKVTHGVVGARGARRLFSNQDTSRTPEYMTDQGWDRVVETLDRLGYICPLLLLHGEPHECDEVDPSEDLDDLIRNLRFVTSVLPATLSDREIAKRMRWVISSPRIPSVDFMEEILRGKPGWPRTQQLARARLFLWDGHTVEETAKALSIGKTQISELSSFLGLAAARKQRTVAWAFHAIEEGWDLDRYAKHYRLLTLQGLNLVPSQAAKVAWKAAEGVQRELGGSL